MSQLHELLHPHEIILLPDITPFATEQACHLIHTDQAGQQATFDGEYQQMTITDNRRINSFIRSLPTTSRRDFLLGGAVAYRTIRQYHQARKEKIPVADTRVINDIRLQMKFSTEDPHTYHIDFLINLSQQQQKYIELLKNTTDVLCEYGKTNEELIEYSRGYAATLDIVSKATQNPI